MNPEVSNRLHIRPHPNRNKHAHALEDRALNSAFQHSASTSGTLFSEWTAVSLASDVFLACLFHSGSSSYVKVSLRSPIITPPFPPKPASSAANETSGLSDNPEDQTELSAEYSAGRRGQRAVVNLSGSHISPRRNPDRAACPRLGCGRRVALSRALIGQKATIKQAELINEPLLSDGLESQSNWCGLPTIPWGDGNRSHDKRRWGERLDGCFFYDRHFYVPEVEF